MANTILSSVILPSASAANIGVEKRPHGEETAIAVAMIDAMVLTRFFFGFIFLTSDAIEVRGNIR